jgi:hypothetical protein
VVSAPKLETLGYLNDEHYYSGFSRLVLGSTVIQVPRVLTLLICIHSCVQKQGKVYHLTCSSPNMVFHT